MTTREKLIRKNYQAVPEMRDELKGREINYAMNEAHPNGDEYAILRKEIKHIEDSLSITPTAEFSQYYADAEKAKSDFAELVE